MRTFHNIVVAVDFSPTSKEALHVACDMAQDGASTLHVLHVVPDVRHQVWAAEAPNTPFEDVQREWYEAAERRLNALSGLPTGARVIRKAVVGTPADASIVDYAAEQRADLIVIGTHGYGPVRRFLLGSVSERVLRHARCPVLTVPPRDASASDDAEVTSTSASQ